tara:strand:- start:179 stop:397 length:219 start_codon:yes stop_codon:yes gene_type:complete
LEEKIMSVKLKPSTKEYKRDARGKIIDKQYIWRHHPPCSFKTDELKSMYTNSAYSRKKHLILKELKRRNVEV